MSTGRESVSPEPKRELNQHFSLHLHQALSDELLSDHKKCHRYLSVTPHTKLSMSFNQNAARTPWEMPDNVTIMIMTCDTTI